MNAKIERADRSAALIACDETTALALIRLLGGSYKIARCFKESTSSAIKEIDLPFETKFNWTVSGYQCSKDLYMGALEELRDMLKAKGLGKSKFLEPDIFSYTRKDPGSIETEELRVGIVRDRILSKDVKNPGIDLIVHGGISGSGPIYAQTIDTIDTTSYDLRDFGRPFQDPTRTVSPRIARFFVNISLRIESRSLLDPFCGLGTILSEALFCGVNLIGVDRDQALVDKARANLSWQLSKSSVKQNQKINLFAYDARRISRARMPRIDAIASEPILVPVFSDNPPVSRAVELIDKTRMIYERCLREFSQVLSKKDSRVVITSPVLIDSSGKARTFDLTEAAHDCGLRPYYGTSPDLTPIRYPFKLRSRKKKTVQRNLNVFCQS